MAICTGEPSKSATRETKEVERTVLFVGTGNTNVGKTVSSIHKRILMMC